MTSTTLLWQDKALTIIAEQLHREHSRVTGEDVRFWLRTKRLRSPSHPNAYGALIRRAIETKLLRPTTKMAASESPTSHGRAQRIYSVTRPRSKAA